MKQRLHPLTQALALILPIGGIQLSPSVALADLQSTTSVVFTGNAIETADSTNPITSKRKNHFAIIGVNPIIGVNQGGTAIKTVGLPTFSPTTGVLTGVQLSTTASSLQQTVSVTNFGNHSGSKLAGGSFGSRSFGSNGVVSVGFSGPGASASSAPFSFTSICLKTGCNSTDTVTHSISLSSAVGGGQLESYVGEKGSALVNLIAPEFDLVSDNIKNRASQTVAWTGNLAATYSFLNHATPSFSLSTPETSLTLDFGTLQLGATEKLNWSIFSPGNNNTVGLDFDKFSSSSADAAKFNIGASLFADLAAGTGRDFTAMLDTSKSGSFIANYLLHFSDANVGASSTRFNYDLNLTLKGNVLQPVPLPAAWTLMVGPVLGCLFSSKSRKRKENS
jgi:hypothetical protein